jgi:hypothetical protein
MQGKDKFRVVALSRSARRAHSGYIAGYPRGYSSAHTADRTSSGRMASRSARTLRSSALSPWPSLDRREHREATTRGGCRREANARTRMVTRYRLALLRGSRSRSSRTVGLDLAAVRVPHRRPAEGRRAGGAWRGSAHCPATPQLLKGEVESPTRGRAASRPAWAPPRRRRASATRRSPQLGQLGLPFTV